MAIFNVARPIKLVVRGARTSIIHNPQGMPMAISEPGVNVELRAGDNLITDEEVISRIRKDQKFGVQDGIMEITEEDREAIEIKKKKMKEADEEIREIKRKKQK